MAEAAEPVQAGALSPRIAHLLAVARAFADDVDPSERGRAITEVFRATEGEPAALRLALALRRMAERETVRIEDGELLVGRARRRCPAHRGIHEGYLWTQQLSRPELCGGELSAVPNPSPELVELYRYWRERPTLGAELAALLSDGERRAMRAGVYSSHGLDFVHRCLDYSLALREGMERLRARAREALAALSPSDPEYDERRAFYRAAMICCEAAVTYAERYAAQAQRLARAPGIDRERRAELEEIAAICRRVPRYPARTFHEALQAVWFVNILDQLEGSGSAQSFGRLDQYLWPYYERDITDGRIDRRRALELIQCLWVKCYKTFDFHYVTVGGVRADGSDGTNELSLLCLEATAALRTPKALGVRVHAGTAQDFLQRAAAVASLGLGRPNFWNDEVVVEAFLRHGVALKDARDYAVIGCVELTIPGRCNPRTMGHSINLLKCLELALCGGRDMRTGEQLGPPCPTHYASFAELRAAFRRQVAHFVKLAIEHDLRAFRLQAERRPWPFDSLLTHDCLARGKDITAGGARYNFAGVNLFGFANAANALAAMAKLVFKERRVSLAELRTALAANFEGYEKLRQLLLNRAPKYGNDDDFVDAIAAEEVAFYLSELARYRTPEGGRFCGLIFGTTGQAVYRWAEATAASADGRRRGEPLAMSCNPAPGTALRGPTAAIRSAAKIDYRQAAGGVSFILDVHPSAVAEHGGAQHLASLIRAFFDQGGMEISFNIASEKTLREAQRHPERYRHLMVRVFGFSTQFVALDRELQEHIIERLRAR